MTTTWTCSNVHLGPLALAGTPRRTCSHISPYGCPPPSTLRTGWKAAFGVPLKCHPVYLNLYHRCSNTKSNHSIQAIIEGLIGCHKVSRGQLSWNNALHVKGCLTSLGISRSLVNVFDNFFPQFAFKKIFEKKTTLLIFSIHFLLPSAKYTYISHNSKCEMHFV